MGSQVLRVWWEFAVRPRLTRRVAAAMGTLLVVVAVALMSVYLEPARVLDAMAGADPGLVALAAVVYLFSWPLRGLRYRDLLAELGFESDVGFLTGAIFISQTGNLVFPARAGDAIRAYVMKARRSVPYPSGAASLAVERVFDLLTISALAGVVLLGLSVAGFDLSGFDAVPADQRESGRVALRVAVAVAALALLAALVILVSARSRGGHARAVVGWFSNDTYADYVAGVIERFASDVQTVASDRGAFVRIGAASLAVWTLDVVTALIVFAAFGVALAPVVLVAVGFFAVSVGNLAKVLPLSPGGIGLYEGAFTLLVVALTSVVWQVALAAAIVDHAVKNVVTVAGGVVASAVLNVSLTTAAERAREVETDAVETD
jgi:uncharacterized protein (TIRG00374 family)